MITTEYDATTNFVELINAELDRLGLSTDFDPCSGLIVENDPESEAVVKIFDDYADGFYYADQVLAELQKLNPNDVSLASEDANNVWQFISDFEVK